MKRLIRLNWMMYAVQYASAFDRRPAQRAFHQQPLLPHELNIFLFVSCTVCVGCTGNHFIYFMVHGCVWPSWLNNNAKYDITEKKSCEMRGESCDGRWSAPHCTHSIRPLITYQKLDYYLGIYNIYRYPLCHCSRRDGHWKWTPNRLYHHVEWIDNEQKG